MARVSDAAWRAIVMARGHVQGKVLYMRADTLAVILAERGIRTPGSHVQSNPHLHGKTLYGVPVVVRDSMLFGSVMLGERQ